MSIEFDRERARSFWPRTGFEKTAILLVPGSDHEVVVQAPFGEQRMRGAFYVVAEGNSSYAAAQAEFERTHDQVGPNTWQKSEPVRAYQTDEVCEVRTVVGGQQEALVTAQSGDWIVRQATGEIMVLNTERFHERYRATPE